MQALDNSPPRLQRAQLQELVSLLRAQRLNQARALFDDLHSRYPQSPGLLELGAVLCSMEGRLDEELRLLRALAEVQGAQPRPWGLLMGALLKRGQLAPAAEAATQLARLAPCLEHWGMLGDLQSQLGRVAEAERSFRRALEFQPDHAVTLFNLALMLAKRDDHAGACALLERCTQLDPGNGEAWLNLGVYLRRLRRLEPALVALKKAVEVSKNPGLALANLASVHEMLQDREAAEQYALQALHHRPDVVTASLVLARLESQSGAHAAAEQRLRGLLGQGLDERDRSRALALLAGVLNKQADYPQALRVMHECNRLKLQLPEYKKADGAGWLRLVDGLASVQARSPRPQVRLQPQVAPIFEVGFPRSGTTLVEQILGAHPELVAYGEPEALSQALVEFSGESGIPYPWGLERLGQPELRRLRQLYLAGLAGDGELPARFVDKHPLHYVHLRLLSQLFPDARVVFVVRDPRDAILSGFFQDMAPNGPMKQLLELEGAARHYVKTMDLYRQLRADLDLPIFELRYEDLVEDVEGCARQMFDFLQLPWSPEVLSYHQQVGRRYVSTPSYEAVRKPVYSSAKARWRRYPEASAVIQPILAPYLDFWGYSSD